MAAITITWSEINGIGTLTAQDDDGNTVAEIHGDPIDTTTDSDSVAYAVLDGTGVVITSVEHDRDQIHVST